MLVARHENEIRRTTDVADHPEFADRQTTKVDRRAPRSPAGSPRTSPWPSCDAARQGAAARRCAPPTPRFDGHYQIPTLDEVLELAPRASARTAGRSASTPRPSTRPTSTRSGSRWRGRCVAALRAPRPRPAATRTVFVQSFETANLRALRPADHGAARAAPRRDRRAGRPGRRRRPATYADLAHPRRAARRSRRTPTASAQQGARAAPRPPTGATAAPPRWSRDAHRRRPGVHV